MSTTRVVSILLALLLGLAACGEEDSCTPQCEGVECGDDGCGGTCGSCSEGSVCSESQCVACSPSCQGRMCGPDGCGGDCGQCETGQVCDPDSYLCIDKPASCDPVCIDYGYDCGPDGCGGECGACASQIYCDPDAHQCLTLCVPHCVDKECGDDGCGGFCGECGDGMECQLGDCVPSDVLPEDDFRILFGYQGRVTGYNDDEYDLYLLRSDGMNPVEPEQPGEQALTEFALQNASDCQLVVAEDAEGNPTQFEPCSCKYGCITDRALDWIAVSIKRPTASGFTFQVGRFDNQLQVAMVKGVTISDVVDFKFGGDYLYYTRLLQCEGVHCRYTFYRQPLNPVGPLEELFVFPPENDPDWPDHTSYKGHFNVSQNGESLVVLGTTIRSLRLYLWRAGVLSELDYVCSLYEAGQCIGAGSEYSDIDPVAISPDGSKVATFTAAEKEFRLRVYDTSNLTQKSLLLFSVAEGTWIADACPVVRSMGWAFRTILGDPVFSPDGSSLYFVANNDCDVATTTDRPHTNVLALDLSAVGDGTAFEETDFRNVTRNPDTDGAANVIIDAMDLSPTGKTVVFTGSPRYGNGELLEDDSDRARRDREIWIIGANGGGMTQLTDDTKYAARAPMAFDASVTAVYNP